MCARCWSLGAVFLAALLGTARADQGACTVQVPVYGPLGNKLDFRVVRVTPQNRPDVDLLKARPTIFQSFGDAFSFRDRALVGQGVTITVENGRGQKITQPVLLMQCPQRVSLRFGTAESYGDVAFQSIRGRFSGCQFSGDWWIRAVPMFGVTLPRVALDGAVQQNGSFSVSGDLMGERYLLVVGKDSQPVKAFGVNVTNGKSLDVGDIDLAGLCPK